jgi:DNA polymerase-1
MLMTGSAYAIDTETTGIEETDRLFGYSVAGQDWEYFKRSKPNELLTQLTQDSSRTWIFQNALFDMRMFGYEGIEFAGDVIDIGIMARLVKNDYLGTRDYSLAAQAKRHLSKEKIDEVAKVVKEKKLYEIRKDYFGNEYKSPRYDWVDADLMHNYASMDARLTYDLYQFYKTKLDTDDKRVLDNEVKLTKVIYKMERTGLKLDVDYTKRAYYYENELLELAKNKYKEHTGHEFVNSAKSIEKHLGIKLPTTDKGNPTLTDDVIDELIGTYPSLEYVRNIRYNEKRISTYYENYLNMQKDGIIRPSYHQYGTRTGRFSSSNPNIQNIPHEEESTEPYVVRGCFVPHDGDVFVSIDYKAQEFRLALDYAGEHALIKAIMNGADPHEATAQMVGLPRKQAKNCTFAALYGAGPAKFALMTGMTEAQARQTLNIYFARLPRLEHFLWQVQQVGKSRGYVKNWLGRKLRADYEHCYALPNHLIQSSGADVMKKAMVELFTWLPKEVKMVSSIHDELVFSMPESMLKIVPDIQKTMESQYQPKNGMVLHTDAKFSRKSMAVRDMEKL